jgi:hypothetical protein
MAPMAEAASGTSHSRVRIFYPLAHSLHYSYGMLSLILVVLLAGAQQPEPPLIRWKAVLMSGDDEIQAFDNARKSIKNDLLQLGIEPGNVRELSMNPAEVQRGTGASSAENLRNSLASLSVGATDGCLVHMTSHGTRQGFVMKNQGLLAPEQLDAMLESACRDRPTVVLVSACYSGIFVQDVMQKPNRVILTAARNDRTSFGCSHENEFTYWDGCLIENLGKAATWQSLHDRIRQCIEGKESRGRFTPSLPQAYFGDQVAALTIPGFSAVASATKEGPQAATPCVTAADSSYGMSVANAVKVGPDSAGGDSGETSYLRSLRGPAGQTVRTNRIGSALFAGTVLRVYELSYEGIPAPIAIYVDVSRMDAPRAPSGFMCAGE